MVSVRGAFVTRTEVHVVAAQPAADASLAETIAALQHRAYAAEAELIGDHRIPHLHETAEQLSAAPVDWLVAHTEDGGVIGAAAWTSDGDVLEIDRLYVDPSLQRRGIGSTLLRSVLDRGNAVVVATASANTPARTLYESFGFRHTADEEVLPGLSVARYALDGSAGFVPPDHYYSLRAYSPAVATLTRRRAVRSSSWNRSTPQDRVSASS